MYTNCGTLVAVEQWIKRLKSTFHNRFVDWSLRLPKRLEVHHLLWICAVVPLFVVPALISFTYSFTALCRGRENAKINFEWVAIISAVNILISAMVLYKCHFELQTFVWHLPHKVMLLIEKLGLVAPSHIKSRAFEI
jgi:hypothetical protein